MFSTLSRPIEHIKRYQRPSKETKIENHLEDLHQITIGLIQDREEMQPRHSILKVYLVDSNSN